MHTILSRTLVVALGLSGGLALAQTAPRDELPLPPPPPPPPAYEPPLPPPPKGTLRVQPPPQAAVSEPPAAEAPPAVREEPKVKLLRGKGNGGIGIEAEGKLDSDAVRQGWAARGGAITGYEAGLGATMMYFYKKTGGGSYIQMTGFGLNGGARLTLYGMKAPSWEARDRTWSAFKIGGGVDLAAFAVDVYNWQPLVYVPYYGFTGGGTSMSATMNQTSVVGTFGFMQAFGAFESPEEWNGRAIGIEWAPSYTATSTTTKASGKTTTTSSGSMNWAGLAFDVQGGSLKSMAAKLAKEAHWKIRVFLLPPVGDIPMIFTTTFAASWY